jgi:hypothetical protein
MTSQASLTKFGYKFGQSGAHSARSMMHKELQLLFQATAPGSTQDQYQSEVCDHNLLDKPTVKSRNLTYRHLLDLYGLSNEIPLFRTFRMLWSLSEEAQSVLALQLALVRDPLLRLSLDFIIEKPLGDRVVREDIEELLKARDPDRFSPASLKSFAQNINGTWTQAGFLKGKAKKSRVAPTLAFPNVIFAIFLAYLEGATGERLFQSRWSAMLGAPEHQLYEHAIVAAHRGIIDFKQSGGITEVRFNDFLTKEEEQWRYE